MSSELYGYDERGHRCGETHPLAALTDAQVEQLRVWHEDHGYGYRRLTDCALLVWGIQLSRFVVRDIVTYRRRNVAAVTWRPVRGVRGVKKPE